MKIKGLTNYTTSLWEVV